MMHSEAALVSNMSFSNFAYLWVHVLARYTYPAPHYVACSDISSDMVYSTRIRSRRVSFVLVAPMGIRTSEHYPYELML